VLTRPFYAGDAQALKDSFDRWEQFPPCVLDAESNAPVARGLPIQMVLYYAREIPSGNGSIASTVDADYAGDDVPETMAASLSATIAQLLTETDSAEWRNCFTTITLLGANLTEAQDQYHNRRDEPTWNLGPNMQFYRMLDHMSAHQDASIMYYMEGDSVPVATGWLDAIVVEIESSLPFSVLGGRYAGHNWDGYQGDTIIKPALRNHLNGNGIYDCDHSVVQTMVRRFKNADAWESTHHSSFDVAFAEYLIEEQHVAEVDLEASPHDYKASSILANFATTLTLPQDLPSTARVVHGAVYMHNWPTPNCTRHLDLEWYPAQPLFDATADNDDGATLLSLIVSDFGEGTIERFMRSLATAQHAVAVESAVHGECDHQDGLPFAEIIIITQNATMAGEYGAIYPNVRFIARDWDAGASAWWDLCTAPVSTPWFMLVTSYFTFKENFKLPIEVAEDGSVVPLIPYVDHDSMFCNRECRLQIQAERQIHPTFNRQFDQKFAVFNTDIRDVYCSMFAQTTSVTDGLLPSTNGYFAFIEVMDNTNMQLTTCKGVIDGPICRIDNVSNECARDDEVGDYVRDVCKMTCGTCSASSIAYNSTRDGEIDEYEHQSKATYDWWERKHGDGSTKSSSAGGRLYKVYDREQFFTVDGFDAEADVILPRGERCNGTACPCIFPFFWDGVKYTDCVDDQVNARWCATSVTNMREYHDESDDWRECSGDRGRRAGWQSSDALLHHAKPIKVRRGNSSKPNASNDATGSTGAVLVHTSLLEPATIGDLIIKIASNDGFVVGNAIIVGLGTASSELNSIVGFGSIILATALTKNHPAGIIISVVNGGVANHPSTNLTTTVTATATATTTIATTTTENDANTTATAAATTPTTSNDATVVTTPSTNNSTNTTTSTARTAVHFTGSMLLAPTNPMPSTLQTNEPINNKTRLSPMVSALTSTDRSQANNSSPPISTSGLAVIVAAVVSAIFAGIVLIFHSKKNTTSIEPATPASSATGDTASTTSARLLGSDPDDFVASAKAFFASRTLIEHGPTAVVGSHSSALPPLQGSNRMVVGASLGEAATEQIDSTMSARAPVPLPPVPVTPEGTAAKVKRPPMNTPTDSRSIPPHTHASDVTPEAHRTAQGRTEAALVVSSAAATTSPTIRNKANRRLLFTSETEENTLSLLELPNLFESVLAAKTRPRTMPSRLAVIDDRGSNLDSEKERTLRNTDPFARPTKPTPPHFPVGNNHWHESMQTATPKTAESTQPVLQSARSGMEKNPTQSVRSWLDNETANNTLIPLATSSDTIPNDPFARPGVVQSHMRRQSAAAPTTTLAGKRRAKRNTASVLAGSSASSPPTGYLNSHPNGAAPPLPLSLQSTTASSEGRTKHRGHRGHRRTNKHNKIGPAPSAPSALGGGSTDVVGGAAIGGGSDVGGSVCTGAGACNHWKKIAVQVGAATEFDQAIRGKCGKCEGPVFTTQRRNKDDKGVYFHANPNDCGMAGNA
jgi:hypothetical protein